MPVYRIFRQDCDKQTGHRLFWLVESEIETMEEFCSTLNAGGIVASILSTEKGSNRTELVIKKRNTALITLSAVHNADFPENYTFVEYV